MGSLLAVVIPLALGAAVSPTSSRSRFLCSRVSTIRGRAGRWPRSGSGLLAFGLLGVTVLRTIEPATTDR